MVSSGPIETVACVGSSTTASKGTYRWIAELESRPQNSRFRFVNLGVGGDLSFDIIRRLRRVVDTQPDRVIVLVGTNDILASVFPNFRRIVRLWKGPPEEPTVQRFEENLQLITRRFAAGDGSEDRPEFLCARGRRPTFHRSRSVPAERPVRRL